MAPGLLTAASTASEMAMPRLPGWFGSLAIEPPPGVRRVARAFPDRAAEHLHEDAAAGLLAVARADHIDPRFDAELGPRVGQGGAPLAGAGLGRQGRDALLGRQPGLHDGRVRLVAADRPDAFVLVEDAGGRIQVFFEPDGVDERGRPEDRIGLEDVAGDRDLPFRCDISWPMKPLEKSPSRSEGTSGFLVTGCRGGSGGVGRSALML